MLTQKPLRMAILALSMLAMMACSKQEQPAEATQSQPQPQPQEVAESLPTGEMTISTEAGESKITANPHPLAVYDLAILQNLAALGVTVEGMPSDAMLNNIKAVNTPESADIGTLMQPDWTLLDELKPQAIFIGQALSENLTAFEKIAPTYQLGIDAKNGIAATKQQLTELGALFGKTQAAVQANQELDGIIAKVKSAAENKGKGLVVLLKDGELTAYGQDSQYGFVHSTFGFPVVQEITAESVEISFAQLQKLNPEWLFVVDYDAAVGAPSPLSLLDNPDVQATSAYQKQQVVYLSADAVLATGSYYQWLTDAQLVLDALNAQAQ